MLEIARLCMSRGQHFSLDIPALVVRPGSIVCVTGPNGSGKTTLIDCITGLLQPAQGVISINNQPITADRRLVLACIGLAPDDEQWFIQELTANEYLGLMERTYRKAGITTDMTTLVKSYAERLHFTAFNRQLEQLSHGNKKKVQLIAALMHQPPVIVIDELRNGLDPLAILAAEQLVIDAAIAGSCVIAATHDLWWAERIADEIVLLINGSVAHHQTKAAIVENYGSVERLFIDAVQA